MSTSPPDDPAASDSEMATEPLHRDVCLQRLDGLRRGLPETPPEIRSALEGELSDADAIVRGTATVAVEVIDESSNALVRLDVAALLSQHGDAIRYPKLRLRYLLDGLFALVEAHAAQSTRASAWARAQEHLAAEVARARVVRNSVLFGLQQATENHSALANEVARVRGRGGRARELIQSLFSLADFVADNLRLPMPAVVLSLGGVHSGDVTRCREAARALQTALDAVHDFPAASRDLPGTNLAEGRFMTELTHLYRALEAHQGVIPGLPRMPLGNTLRREFDRLATATEPESEPAPA